MRYLKKITGTIVVILLLVIGITLIFNKKIESFIVKTQIESYNLNQFTKKSLQKNNELQTSFDIQKVNTMSPEAVLKAKLSNKRLPIIGGIAIPDVSLNLPIFKGVSNESLLWGAGTLFESQKMGEGNYALASHRAYEPELLFSPLEKVKVGEKIYLTDLSNIYEYTVQHKEKVSPTSTELLDVQPERKLVTLVTCGDINATTRLVVQGIFIKSMPVDEASQNIIDAFEIEQKTY